MKKYNYYFVLIIGVVSLITLFAPMGQYQVTNQIVIELRLPRLLFALIGGGFIGISALLFQTTLRRPYVDGSMLGIASGAELCSAVVALIFPTLLSWRVLMGALFAIICLLILRQTVFRLFNKPLLLLMYGLTLAMFFNAITLLITNGQGLMGKSLSTVTIKDAWQILFLALLGSGLLYLHLNKLRYFALPSQHLHQIGISEARFGLPLQILGAGSIGAVSSVLGTTFFVGLILAQLIILMKGGAATDRVLTTILIGAVALSISDFLAHVVFYPIELPSGSMLMLLTAPFMLFIWRGDYEN